MYAKGLLLAAFAVVLTGCGGMAERSAVAESAPDRVFMLLGTESTGRLPPQRGSTVASDVWRPVRDVAELPDGRIVVLTSEGQLDVIDVRGRIARLPSRVLASDEGRLDLDVAADGAVLVVAGGRLWRVNPAGGSTALTPAASGEFDAGVLAVDAVPGGGYVYTEAQRVWRVAPDGVRTLLAGSGEDSDPRRGPAVESPLQWPVRIAALDDGRVVFVDESPLSGARSTWVIANGALQPLPRFERVGAGDLLALPGGRLAVLADGVRVLGERLVVRTEADPPPLWAGLEAGRVAIGRATAIAATASGDWLVATGEGIALVAGSADVPRRLAVAVHLATRATLRQRRIRVAATRAATVEVTAGKRVVARGRVASGVTTLRLTRRLPAGEVVLRLRAVGDDGAAASHRLTVLTGRELPLAAARRAALDAAWDFGGDIQPYVERCRRLRRAAAVCWVSGVSERRIRGRLELRSDGWIWVSWGVRFLRTGPR